MLRSKSRFGDPFAHLGAGKRAAAEAERADPAALTERYNVEALEKSGTSFQGIVPCSIIYI
jgi:hypothetical protein